MTHHLDAILGLYADPGTFYARNDLRERAAFALEWVNAYAHATPELRGPTVFHGGTAVQLQLGELQRLSRDIDLLSPEPFDLRPLLEAIAVRYEQRMFGFRHIGTTSVVPGDSFRLTFPSRRGGAPVDLSLDVVYLPVELPSEEVKLSASRLYRPRNAEDAVHTLTIEAFVADKLPTLGFETHGYPRPDIDLPGEGHPEHVWKQLHDIGGLLERDPDLGTIRDLYERGITARDRARGTSHGVDACLLDALRVCRLACVAEYPAAANDDPSWLSDVLHVQEGVRRFALYQIRRRAPAILHRLYPARVAALLRALAHIRAGDLTPETARALLGRAREVARRPRAVRPKDDPLRRRLAGVQPDAWWPEEPIHFYDVSREGAILWHLASRWVAEAEHFARAGALSLEG